MTKDEPNIQSLERPSDDISGAVAVPAIFAEVVFIVSSALYGRYVWEGGLGTDWSGPYGLANHGAFFLLASAGIGGTTLAIGVLCCWELWLRYILWILNLPVCVAVGGYYSIHAFFLFFGLSK